ncbi:MAG: MlaD family protein [Solirubrobacteraceae bacterium]
MRRAPVIAALCAVAVATAIVIGTRGGGGYRVDAIFDTAKGMVPGQLVEIAGARVGTVTAVKLLSPGPRGSGYRALMELSVDRRFAPFHADARCQVLPQGPISENYVECSPGTMRGGPLSTGPLGRPTIPVTHNTEALDIQDVLNVFTMPTDQRLGILINELGIATAGRGADLSAIIKRANPALDQARRVLTVLDAQRAAIGAAVVQTDHILSALATTNGGVRTFVDKAAAVARTTAAHRAALGQGVAKLPAMLTELNAGLRSIDRVTGAGTPLLRALSASAPGLTTLTSTLTDFSHAGLPALNALAPAARTGQTAITAARPLVHQLRRFGTSEGTTSYLLDHLLTSSRDAGAIDGALLVLYGITANDAAYDNVSHFLAIVAQVYPGCIANNTAPGCRHTYNSPGAGTLPVNDPSAGPQSNWSPTPGLPEQSHVGAPAPANAPATSAIPSSRMRSLLGYLLK